jgi:hypothetical protein
MFAGKYATCYVGCSLDVFMASWGGNWVAKVILVLTLEYKTTKSRLVD